MMTPFQSSTRRPVAVLYPILAAQTVVLVLMVIGAHLFFSADVTNRGEVLGNIIFSVSFAQVMLLATWNAFAGGKLPLRPIGSLLCVMVTWVGASILVPHVSEMPILGIAMFVQWVLFQIPLWFARLRFGWQIGFVDDESSPGRTCDVRFGIRHLMTWMTLVAIILGLGKYMLQFESVRSRDTVAFGLFLICNCLFAWPITLSTLVDLWMPATLSAAFLFAIGITTAEPVLFHAVLGNNASGPNIFLWMNGIQFVWIAGTMLILRRYGFRLVRYD